jgi:hypothetical protein
MRRTVPSAKAGKDSTNIKIKGFRINANLQFTELILKRIKLCQSQQK